MLEIVNILSSYMFRKTVSSMNLTGVFANWIATLYPKISINEKILDNFIFEITNLNGKRLSFVTDDEFKTALTGAEVYNSNYKKYIIKKLESVQSKEKVLFDNLTVDHIIPQKLDINWKQRVAYNDKSRSEYSRILHSLGNLTLTGYNSEKKNTDKDIFSDSNLLMNRKIDIKTFDLKSVENRTKEMVELALNIWPSPKLTVNNSSNNKNKIEINFFDIIIEDYEESPSKLHIGEKNYLIDDWNSLFQILTNEFSEYFSHTELKGNTNQKFNTVIDKLDSLSQDEIIRIEF